MRALFCAQPFTRPTVPDPDYAAEAEAAREAGFDIGLLDFEALVYEDDPEGAIRRIPPAETPETAVYRGWMLRPAQYARLYVSLKDKGLLLLNDPDAYRHCHHFPESYALIEPYTPRSVWLPYTGRLDVKSIMEALQIFGERPTLVKDFVKSRKHEWEEACYIPTANDRDTVERVVTRFLELQGEDLNEGLVFREYEPFQALALHSKSGMPLIQEYRLFFMGGKRLFASEYWEEGHYADNPPPADLFGEVARTIRSRFFTMDVAHRKDGEWRIIELGDGQVAGLPERVDVKDFYRALYGALA